MKPPRPSDILLPFIIALLIAGCIALSGCVDVETKEPETVAKAIRVSNLNFLYEVTVDGCEYILYDGDRKGGIIHKANCKNHPK